MNIFIWKIWNNLLIHLKIICLHQNNEISIEFFEETIATRLERNLFEQILLEKCSKLPRINKISITKNINLRMRIFSRRDPSRALLPFILENKRQHFPSLRAIKTTPAKSYAPKSPAATLDIWQSGVFVLERGKSAGKTKNGKKKKRKKKTGTRICRVSRGCKRFTRNYIFKMPGRFLIGRRSRNGFPAESAVCK